MNEKSTREHYVSSSYMNMVLPLLDQLAINKAEFFAYADVDVKRLNDNRYRISHGAVCLLWQKLYDITQDDTIGIQAGRFASSKTLYPLGQLISLAKTPLEGLETVLSHFHLFSNTANLSLVKMKSCYSLRFNLNVDENVPATNIDAFLSALITICRQHYGDDFSPLSLRTRSKKIMAEEFVQRFFRCPIFYEDKIFELTFNHHSLEKSTVNAVDHLSAVNQEFKMLQLKEELKTLDNDDFIIQLKVMVKRNISDNKQSLHSMASRLFLGERTLQRKLAKNQYTYRKLVEECRYEMALDYLQFSDLSLTDISDLIGFSSYSNFARAFKKWTGQPPTKYSKSENVII